MNLFAVFYIGTPLLALVAGLLSKLNNRTLTTVFNVLMLLVVLAGAVWVFAGHHGWLHILSLIALTIIGNLVGVLITGARGAGRKKKNR